MGYIKSWHRGEQEVRHKMGYDKVPSTALLFTSISEDLPEQHAEFHSTRIPFLPVVTLDEEGRPWGSVLTSKTGQTGFIHYPGYNTQTLIIEADLWDGDPLQYARSFQDETGSMLVAGIGVELSTRRRNKFAGSVVKLQKTGNTIRLELAINEALGSVSASALARFRPNNADNESLVIVRNTSQCASWFLMSRPLQWYCIGKCIFSLKICFLMT
jgi:predicted pyridoxine 5'-phosphate oxidase superfamily flavin-nucleotide-binding protein